MDKNASTKLASRFTTRPHQIIQNTAGSPPVADRRRWRSATRTRRTNLPELRLTTTSVALTVAALSAEEFASLFCVEAWRALARNKLRSTLAAVAIMIGIASVVCVVAIG